MDTLQIIEEEPKRLIEVPGLGPARTEKIADAWDEQKAIKEVMLFLQTVEVSTSIAVRIYKKYGDASISVVKNQPYRLASDVWGIGFLTADKIAQSVGIPHDSPDRVKAGLAVRPVAGHRPGALLSPRGEADRRRGEAAPGGHRPGHRVPGRAGSRPPGRRGPRRRTREGPRPGGRRPRHRRLPRPLPPRRAGPSAQLRRPLRADEDRMPAFTDAPWDRALSWPGEPHRRRPRPRAGGRRQTSRSPRRSPSSPAGRAAASPSPSAPSSNWPARRRPRWCSPRRPAGPPLLSPS
ncbi:hypothetical protein LV779_03325 [Streptomyces thinghirensis]|nr:hypothetical protein [Streptomyces thinghirensis]